MLLPNSEYTHKIYTGTSTVFLLELVDLVVAKTVQHPQALHYNLVGSIVDARRQSVMSVGPSEDGIIVMADA